MHAVYLTFFLSFYDTACYFPAQSDIMICYKVSIALYQCQHIAQFFFPFNEKNDRTWQSSTRLTTSASPSWPLKRATWKSRGLRGNGGTPELLLARRTPSLTQVPIKVKAVLKQHKKNLYNLYVETTLCGFYLQYQYELLYVEDFYYFTLVLFLVWRFHSMWLRRTLVQMILV